LRARVIASATRDLIRAPEFAMTKEYRVLPRNIAPPPSEERASDVLSDWWRQIDRWVNEGGAIERTAAQEGYSFVRVEP
jgi:hypothetical protein